VTSRAAGSAPRASAHRLVTAAASSLVRFVDLQGFDRAVALAGQAFTALIPLLIVYAALVSPASGSGSADQLIRVFDLSGDAARSVKAAFAPAGGIESDVSALGAVLLVGFALSFTRALQCLYQLGWSSPGSACAPRSGADLDRARHPHPHAAARHRQRHAWCHAHRALDRTHDAAVAGHALRPAGATGPVALPPAALLAGIAMTALSVGWMIWMPRTVSSSAEQVGELGGSGQRDRGRLRAPNLAGRRRAGPRRGHRGRCGHRSALAPSAATNDGSPRRPAASVRPQQRA